MHDGSGWFSVSFRGFLLEKKTTTISFIRVPETAASLCSPHFLIEYQDKMYGSVSHHQE